MSTVVLTVIDEAERSEAFLRHLAAYCAGRRAHLIVIVLTPLPMLFHSRPEIGGMYLPEMVMRNNAEAEAGRVRHMLTDHLERTRVVPLFGDALWLPSDVAAQLPMADGAVIADRSAWAVPWFRGHIIEALLRRRVSVRLQPAVLDFTRLRRAVMGVKAGAEAQQAAWWIVHNLPHDCAIDLIAVGEQNPFDGPAHLLDYLRLHRYQATQRRVDREGTTTDTLARHAAERGADLLVIGASVHAAWRDRLFGGVTRRLIDHAALPTILAR